MSILTPPITDTAKLLIASLKKAGITNKFLVAGILGTIYKETNFRLRPEVGYGKTANARIRSIFGKRLADLTEDQLTALKATMPLFLRKCMAVVTATTCPAMVTNTADGVLTD
jgi:hypothetical protein